MPEHMDHLKHLPDIAHFDCCEIEEKERTYKGSWKKRGGVGAAMMMLRKADRLEVMLKDRGYDVFEAIEHDLNGLSALPSTALDGTVLAEIRDLRRYLLLIESEIAARLAGRGK